MSITGPFCRLARTRCSQIEIRQALPSRLATISSTHNATKSIPSVVRIAFYKFR